MDYSPQGHKKSDMTEVTGHYFYIIFKGYFPFPIIEIIPIILKSGYIPHIVQYILESYLT